MLRLACSLIAAAGLAITPVLAQHGHTPPAERNAALAYATVFYGDMPEDLTGPVESVNLDEIGLDAGRLPQNAVEAVRARQGTVTRLIAITKMPRCDFEIAYERGFNALLPHLGPMRKAARVIRFDARRMLLEGRPDESAARVASLYRISGHLKNDEVLISVLVSNAIAALANKEAGALIESGKLTAVGREEVVKAITDLGRNDPFGFKSAIIGEKDIAVSWVRREFSGKGGSAAFAKLVGSTWGEDKEVLAEVEALDEKQFHVGLDRVDEFHTIIQTLWDSPDAADKLSALSARVKSGDFGPVAKLLVPELSKARRAKDKGEAELASTLQKLKDYMPPAANRPPTGSGE